MSLKFKSDLDDSSFKKSLMRMEKDTSRFTGLITAESKKSGMALAGIGGGLKSLAGGLGIGIGIGAVTSFTKSVIDMGATLNAFSDGLSVNIEDLQRYGNAFAQASVSQEDFRKGLGELNMSIGKAMEGDRAKIDAAARLGISFDQLSRNAQEPIEVMRLMSDGFKNADDKGQAYRDTVELLGKAGKSMAAGMAGGAEALDQVAKSTRALTKDQAAALDAMGNKWANFWLDVKVGAAQTALGVGKIFDPESYKNGKWLTGTRTAEQMQPGITPPADHPDDLALAKLKIFPLRDESPAEWANRREGLLRGAGGPPATPAEIAEERLKHDTMQLAEEQQAAAMERFKAIGRAEALKYGTSRMRDDLRANELRGINGLMEGQDPVRRAQLEAQRFGLLAEDKADRVRRLQMSPDERRSEMRAERDLQRAANRAERDQRRLGITKDIEQARKDAIQDADRGKNVTATISDADIQKIVNAIDGLIPK